MHASCSTSNCCGRGIVVSRRNGTARNSNIVYQQQQQRHMGSCCAESPRSGHPTVQLLTATVIGSLSTLPVPGASYALEAASQLTAEDPGAAEAMAAQVAAALAAGNYTPSPMAGPGEEVWIGFLAGVIPFAVGSWEFGKRILIQQRCKVCSGKGLVPSSKEGTKYVRKCPQCGGFFPWVSWKLFLTSTAAPGNGGPLQQPKGQTSVFYKVPPPTQSSPSQQLEQDPVTSQTKSASEDALEQGLRGDSERLSMSDNNVTSR